MYYKTYLLNNMHKLHRKDPYIDNHMGAVGTELDYVKGEIENVGKEFFFDSMSDVGVGVKEKEMNFRTSGTIEDRRSQIEARWKTGGKCSKESLQGLADSWRNGEIKVFFLNGVIVVNFVSLIGIPYDIENLKKAIEEAKPAHLDTTYNFIYRTWGMVKALGHPCGYYKAQGYTCREMREKEAL